MFVTQVLVLSIALRFSGIGVSLLSRLIPAGFAGGLSFAASATLSLVEGVCWVIALVILAKMTGRTRHYDVTSTDKFVALLFAIPFLLAIYISSSGDILSKFPGESPTSCAALSSLFYGDPSKVASTVLGFLLPSALRVIVLAPFIEELIFCRFGVPVEKRLGDYEIILHAAVLGAIFVLFHVHAESDLVNTKVLLSRFWIRFILVVVYLKTQSLRSCILIHAFNNAAFFFIAEQ